MDRFAYVSIYLHICKFAQVFKCGHVNRFTHVCKICSIRKSFTFAPNQGQVQVFVCIFTHMQILSCERKVKFACLHTQIYPLRHINVDLTLFQCCVSSRIIVSLHVMFAVIGIFNCYKFIYIFKFSYVSICLWCSTYYDPTLFQ